MKKNFRVIQINGFRGILIALFTVSCLIAGFVAFPAFLTMNAWNYLAITTTSFPSINFVEGVLLWAIIAFSIFIFNKRKFIVSFNTQQELSEDEIMDVVSKFKSQTKNRVSQDLSVSALNAKLEQKNKNDNSEEQKDSQIEHEEV